MRSIVLVALSTLGVAVAQSSRGNFTIDPASVEPRTRAEWCNAQYNSCRTLCGGRPKSNDCDTETLEYDCTCSNGTAPGLEYYIQTMPTFICEQAYTDCIAANTGSSKAQDDCKTNIKEKCGTLDPNKAQVDSGDGTGSSSSASSTASATGPASSAAVSSSTSAGGAAPTGAFLLGNGIAVAAAGVFAAML
ncbi:uncharacterized protein CTHT_0053340 [Thermochaetoides thermophila DSM 1495]|uniref:DUF7707 domain-containing protein n=1 Tax=Chaetomium thermophilum (strain DSM 1495 / CBS 144.50 / IMI 039719) TaxID=759272 RepID=G0SDX5_CHATD|nr:hypothetical protein CTHT_0053340 [Thermochaetoides thermophila DSM 1495]EGS18726.1 hypothetical protein CTHT_0053340 [Thermochaetoides thermophila DSM 1495]